MAAIHKAEKKDDPTGKNSRNLLLSKFKTVDSKPIDPNAMKKLEMMAKKNGIDPSFMAATFGIEKNHNP